MASEKAAVASGADFDQATRRRNVQSTSPGGGIVDRVEIDEKKTRVKKVNSHSQAVQLLCDLRRNANILLPIRMNSHYFNS
jgi:dolichyl-phosphate-mannose-protein mannosyltransferase